MGLAVVGAVGRPARALAETDRVAGQVVEQGVGVALAAVMAAGAVAGETGQAVAVAATVTRGL